MNSPYINRFLQPDSIIPDETNPQSLNRSCYVGNNPLRYSDPSGHARLGRVANIGRVDPVRKKAGCNDKRDLTDWMPKGLTYMANYPKVKEIFKTKASWLNAHAPAAGDLVTFGDFKKLVQDNSPFDIKRVMWRTFGQNTPIKLGDSWYENSTPGNIAYGFYGTAAGYDPLVLHAGAGFAQFKDAYLDRDGPAGELRYLMDTSDDYAAVELGIALFNEDFLPDQNLTQAEFVDRLNSYGLPRVSAPGKCQPATKPYSDDAFINR